MRARDIDDGAIPEVCRTGSASPSRGRGPGGLDDTVALLNRPVIDRGGLEPDVRSYARMSQGPGCRPG